MLDDDQIYVRHLEAARDAAEIEIKMLEDELKRCHEIMTEQQDAIERIDNNGNYEPSNCRWATPPEQSRNTRRTRLFALGERVMCLTDLCKATGVSRDAVRGRAKYRGGDYVLAFRSFGVDVSETK